MVDRSRFRWWTGARLGPERGSGGWRGPERGSGAESTKDRQFTWQEPAAREAEPGKAEPGGDWLDWIDDIGDWPPITVIGQ